jgi:hypothetical protein
MVSRRFCAGVAGAAVLFAVLWGCPVAVAAQKETPKDSGTVFGVLLEVKDAWITLQVDGQEEPVKYVIADGFDRKMLNGIFHVQRVQVAYKSVGEVRQLVGIRKAVTRATGTVTGVVTHTHVDQWWIEVKPKDGPPDGYCAKTKEMSERLKELKPGDVVTIKFTTDFERHRIETLQKMEK